MSVIIWFSCDPFHGSSNNGSSDLSVLDSTDTVRASLVATSFSDLASKCASAVSGDVIACSFNEVSCNAQLVLDKMNAYITITNTVGYSPVLNFSAAGGSGDSGSGILITGSRYTIRWIHVKDAGGKGFLLKSSGSSGSSSYNTFVACKASINGDSGFYIGTGSKSHTQDNTQCGYNTFTNCDSWLNFDADGSTGAGGNADGFSPKLDPGPGNVFYGCRAWKNSDDGWDQYSSFNPVTIDHCWTWHNGDRNDYSGWSGSWGGNGQGIKIGGGTGKHLVQYCTSAYNMYGKLDGSSNVKGFDQNGDTAPCDILNNVSFHNNVNYGWWNTSGQVYLLGNLGWDFVTKSDGHPGENAHFDCSIEPGSQTPASIGGTSASVWTTVEANALNAPRSGDDGALPTTGDYAFGVKK
jgi:hypothetical protein